MGNQVALDGRSMHDERTCDQNACKPVWCICEPIWHLKHQFLNRDMRDEHADQTTEHGDQPIYQTEHFKHIPVILHMKIKSWII